MLGEGLCCLKVVDGDEGAGRHEGLHETSLQDDGHNLAAVARGPELFGDVILADGVLQGEVEVVAAMWGEDNETNSLSSIFSHSSLPRGQCRVPQLPKTST